MTPARIHDLAWCAVAIEMAKAVPNAFPDPLLRKVEMALIDYRSARAIRTFEHHGYVMAVVRRRDGRGGYYRKYTALLHKGVWISDDCAREKTDEQETWEVALTRAFPDKSTFECALSTSMARYSIN